MSIRSSSGSNVTSSGRGGGGSPTGGYDPLGMGVVDMTRPSRSDVPVGMTLEDVRGGDSSDDAYVAAIQANVDRQLAEQAVQRSQQAVQRLQQAGLPQTVQQGFAAGTSPYAQLSARGNLNQLPDFGILSALNALGKRTASGIMERIQRGGIPVYDKTGQIVGVRTRSEIGDKATGLLGEAFGFEPEPTYSYFGRPDYQISEENAIRDQFGNIIGYEAGVEFSQEDGEPSIAPEATTDAAVQEPEPEKSMIPMGYRYPADGYYPEEGRFMRTGLLDVAPTTYGGLLAGYDPTQFAAMNVAFRQPTDVGLFVDPYDVKGYTRIS